MWALEVTNGVWSRCRSMATALKSTERMVVSSSFARASFERPCPRPTKHPLRHSMGCERVHFEGWNW